MVNRHVPGTNSMLCIFLSFQTAQALTRTYANFVPDSFQQFRPNSSIYGKETLVYN